jgi:hypothetical protein
MPGEPFGVVSESRVPIESHVPVESPVPSPSDVIHSKDIENWIRKSPQKIAENDVEPTKLFDSKNLKTQNKPETTEHSPGTHSASDRQLFSFIDRLMKVKAPETDSKLIVSLLKFQ